MVSGRKIDPQGLAAGRDDIGENVTRAAVAVCFTPNANALKFAGVHLGAGRAALDCRRNRAASSRNALKFHNTLASELSACDAARRLTCKSFQKRQVRADERSSRAAVPVVEVQGGSNEGSRESTRELVARCLDGSVTLYDARSSALDAAQLDFCGNSSDQGTHPP